MSFLWGCTWSFVTPPLAALIPLVVTLLLISRAYLFGFRSYMIYPIAQITLLTLCFWAFAIIYHTLVYTTSINGAFGRGTFGYGGYPGYYLHSFAPALTPVIAIAIASVARHWWARILAWVLLSYSIVFLFGATFMQFLYFAGCGSNGSQRFDVASASACWNHWQYLSGNLDTLAYPLTAFCFAAAGGIALGWGALVRLVPANNHTAATILLRHSPLKRLPQEFAEQSKN
jgi:hypothetical protein